MDKKNQIIIDEIDALIEEISQSDEKVPQEVTDLIEDISTRIASIKKGKEDKKELHGKFDELVKAISENSTLTEGTTKDLISAIEKINIEPVVNVSPPEVNVTVPEVKLPTINIPETKIPEIKVPKSEFTYNAPKEIDIKKPSWLSPLLNFKAITDSIKTIEKLLSRFSFPKEATDPVSVRLSDGFEFYKARGGGGSSVGGGGAGVTLTDLLARYKIEDIDDDAEPNYYGFTTHYGGWYILKEFNNSYRYATGENEYGQNWDDRVGLPYDYLFNITLYD